MSNTLEVFKKIDDSMSKYNNQDLIGFEKAFVMSSKIVELRELLTDEYMKPIMALQGIKLGFLTDRDKNRDGTKGKGYTIEVVRDCLIEAIFMGLQPYENQFNIISGNMYPTKEGIGYLLNKENGLSYQIIPNIKTLSSDKKSALVEASIEWTINGKKDLCILPIPIKTDEWTSVDAIIGKATRKARAWLLSRIKGIDIVDSELEPINIPHTVVNNNISIKSEDEIKFELDMINTKKDLDMLWKQLDATQQIDLKVLFDEKEKNILK